MQIRNQLTDQLGVDFPMIMAPMFLVSNEAMMKAAIDNGINFLKHNFKLNFGRAH